MEVKSELVHRFNHLFRKKQSKKSILAKENESLLEEIQQQRDLISHLEEALKEANSKLLTETERSFEEGLKVGRNIAEAEEIGVLEELKMLKEIESALAKSTNVYNHSNNIQSNEQSFRPINKDSSLQ